MWYFTVSAGNIFILVNAFLIITDTHFCCYVYVFFKKDLAAMDSFREGVNVVHDGSVKANEMWHAYAVLFVHTKSQERFVDRWSFFK